MRKNIFMSLLLAVLLLAVQGTPGMAQAGSFSHTDQLFYFRPNADRQASVRHNGGEEIVRFIRGKAGILRLYDKDKTAEYLSFTPYPSNVRHTYCSVREIWLEGSLVNKLYEIEYTAGTHAQNCGYWLAGKSGGQWVVFVSLDSLAAQGYDIDKWQRIKSEIIDGDLILTSMHTEVPPGVAHYQGRQVVDFQARIFWDVDADCCGIERLE